MLAPRVLIHGITCVYALNNTFPIQYPENKCLVKIKDK